MTDETTINEGEPWWASQGYFASELRERVTRTLGEAQLGRIEDGIRVQMAEGRAAHFEALTARLGGEVTTLGDVVGALRGQVETMQEAAARKRAPQKTTSTRRNGAAP